MIHPLLMAAPAIRMQGWYRCPCGGVRVQPVPAYGTPICLRCNVPVDQEACVEWTIPEEIELQEWAVYLRTAGYEGLLFMTDQDYLNWEKAQ